MNQWQEQEGEVYEEPYYQENLPQENLPLLSDLQMPFWLKISLLLFVLALLLVMTWWSSSNPFRNETILTADPLASTTGLSNNGSSFAQTPSRVVPAEIERELGRYYSNSINLSFVLPDGWREVTIPTDDLPPGVEEPHFTLYSEEENCVIAAARFNRGAADYAQTSFGGRVFSDVSQFDGSWYTNQAFHADKIEFSDHRRQYLSHEIRNTYNLSVTDLMLFERDANSVPISCDQDFATFLSSTEHHYLPKQYESYEAGEITTRGLSSRGGSGTTKLVFTSDIDGNTYSLMDIPISGFGSRLFLLDGKIYFTGGEVWSQGTFAEQSFYWYDLETNELSRINRPQVDQNPLISSMYVTKDALYYLSGSTSSVPCIDGPGYDCEQQLYRLPLPYGPAELLASSTPATHIMGYVENQDTLYMQSGYGDAGCVGTRVYVHVASSTYEAARLGGCVGEPGYEEYQTEMQGLAERMDETTTKAIRHYYGSYTTSDFEPSWRSASFVIVD